MGSVTTNPNLKKEILEADTVSTPELFTDNSIKYLMNLTPVKKPSDIKSLRLLTTILDVKKETDVRLVGDDKSKHKAIKAGTTMWENYKKGNLKINNQIKQSIYECIMRHQQVVKSPIFNDCLKVNIDGYTGPQIFPK